MKDSKLSIVDKPTMLALAVLAFAEKEPLSGKTFAGKVKVLTKGEWVMSPGLVYPLLAKMEGEGLLKSQLFAPRGKGRREIAYSPTAKRTAFLKKARSKSKEFLHKMITRIVPLSTLVFFGDDDPEFIELNQNARMLFNEKVWRAFGQGRGKRIAALRSLIRAIGKV